VSPEIQLKIFCKIILIPKRNIKEEANKKRKENCSHLLLYYKTNRKRSRPRSGIKRHTISSVAMAHGIKIIGYADDWIIHTTHKHERVSVVKLQKAMDKIVRWADNTGFQISIEKTKAIMLSCKNTAIASRLQTNTGCMDQRNENRTS
jgi:hypothetical protein